ncbi:VQ motif-containing protein 17 [Striga hermonthica]|uniref:VQ motif-containing protein 17 n=1 Tax=Striga hermonthica TaxID=68872 RepID=A0A9N7NAX9_STRHE|nr:VQ motif-containing protein 17 [Striga hermonthica]
MKPQSFTKIAGPNKFSVHDYSRTLSKIKPKIRIIHVIAPEIIKTDVENFRELVQRLTGKPEELKKADKLLSRVLTCRDPESTGGSDVVPVLQETQMKKEVEEIHEADNSNSYLSFWREVDGFLQEPNETPLLSLG